MFKCNSFEAQSLLFLALYFSQFPNLFRARKLFSELQQNQVEDHSPNFLTICSKIKEIHWRKAEQELKLAQRNSIEIISIAQPEYPEKLRNIPDAPLIIYKNGTLNIENSVAIVGSRECSHYGLSIAEEIAAELSSLGIAVVSGLALGIDCAAHLGAIKTTKSKGSYSGVAVLGSGLLEISPKTNLPIAEELLASGGCIVSEYPLQQKAESYFFPERNRIVSGISNAVIIVEAKERSGSLITARLALEQGRDVYAVPGGIKSIHSKGCNKLIQDGAKVFTDITDLKETFSFLAKQDLIQPKPAINLTKEQKTIYDIITAEIEISKDKLYQISNLPQSRVDISLAHLELSGLIKINFNACIELAS